MLVVPATVILVTIGGLLGFASGNGPVVLNRVYDVTGSYTPALWAAIPLSLLSAGLFLCLGRYPEQHGAAH